MKRLRIFRFAALLVSFSGLSLLAQTSPPGSSTQPASSVPASRVARLRRGINTSQWFAQVYDKRGYTREHFQDWTTAQDIAQGLEKNQIIVIGPARPGSDYRVLRSAFANRCGQLRLYSLPAVTIGKLRLVQDFKKDSLRIPGRIMPRQRPPEVGELLNKGVVFRQP